MCYTTYIYTHIHSCNCWQHICVYTLTEPGRRTHDLKSCKRAKMGFCMFVWGNSGKHMQFIIYCSRTYLSKRVFNCHFPICQDIYTSYSSVNFQISFDAKIIQWSLYAESNVNWCWLMYHSYNGAKTLLCQSDLHSKVKMKSECILNANDLSLHRESAHVFYPIIFILSNSFGLIPCINLNAYCY